MVSFIKPSAAANMKQYLMPSYGEIMKHALTCKAIGAEVCSSVWCEFVLVKVNMNQLGVILYLNMYVCKFEPIQHVFRQKAFCKESILFHSYTLFYSLQRGQGIFIAINYTHVFSGDPNYENHPALTFIESCPTDWETTLVPNAEIGKYVTIARKERGADNWFIGSVTDESARDLTVALDFLDKGEKYKMTIYEDGPGADYRTNPYPLSIRMEEVTADSVIKLHLAPSGGAAIRIIKVE